MLFRRISFSSTETSAMALALMFRALWHHEPDLAKLVAASFTHLSVGFSKSIQAPDAPGNAASILRYLETMSFTALTIKCQVWNPGEMDSVFTLSTLDEFEGASNVASCFERLSAHLPPGKMLELAKDPVFPKVTSVEFYESDESGESVYIINFDANNGSYCRVFRNWVGECPSGYTSATYTDTNSYVPEWLEGGRDKYVPNDGVVILASDIYTHLNWDEAGVYDSDHINPNNYSLKVLHVGQNGDVTRKDLLWLYNNGDDYYPDETVVMYFDDYSFQETDDDRPVEAASALEPGPESTDDRRMLEGLEITHELKLDGTKQTRARLRFKDGRIVLFCPNGDLIEDSEEVTAPFVTHARFKDNVCAKFDGNQLRIQVSDQDGDITPKSAQDLLVGGMRGLYSRISPRVKEAPVFYVFDGKVPDIFMVPDTPDLVSPLQVKQSLESIPDGVDCVNVSFRPSKNDWVVMSGPSGI
ncbi:MAG: hypothetical protein O3A01_03410 [bacterium]|nr:hypothetical protein [bacterium]